MKIAESIKVNNATGDVEHRKTFVNQPYIELAKAVADQNGGVMGESRCAGIIPMHLLYKWYKDAGIDPTDQQACADLVRQKMLSGEFDKLRVWKGTF